jgi:glycosyltransferase involved in cell wall biosynthesis
MIMRLGIGIATFNRRDVALATASRVMAHTLHPYTLMIADDGSRDGTAEALLAQRLTVVGGPNRGVAWNKNRILFYLMELARCDVVILLEDDTFPARDGWERDWIVAAARHGHVNLAAGPALAAVVGGAGTGEQPFLTPAVVSHCSAFAREATRFGGYFDTRFSGCGYENIEYAQRLLRYGYGGVPAGHGELPLACHYALPGGVTVTTPPSHLTEAGVTRNRAIAHMLAEDDEPRACWRDRGGMLQFRAEMAAAFPRIRQQIAADPPAPALVTPAAPDPDATAEAAPAVEPTRRARRARSGAA